MKTYTVHSDYHAQENSIIERLRLSELVDTQKFDMRQAWINVGGWQSWNPGFEVAPGKKQPALNSRIIKGWNNYLVFPNSKFKPGKDCILGQFVAYLRWDDFYLVFASVGNVSRVLPPVQFIFEPSQNLITIEICDKGNDWRRDDITAQIEIFTASSYFECKEKLREIFNSLHFSSIAHLGKSPAGWESWYNHYADINESLILNDLEALTKTENIISKGSFSSRIFQIDDGWEQALGDWQPNAERFPNGLAPLAQKICQAAYIPGLWIAPFIIDSRSKTAREHPDWLLHNEKHKPVIAGYNPLWGKGGNFYCLDLSNDQVLEYLDSLIDTIINDWGFRYLKLDFMYAGMLYGDYKNPTASYKIYNRAVSTLTSRKKDKNGNPVAYLGCGIPFELSFKYTPLCRIGCDTYEHWKNSLARFLKWNGRNEAYLNLKDTLGHALWDNTIFANDPDVIFIRTKNCSLTTDEKLLIAKVNSLFGSQFMYSDDPQTAGPQERSLEEEIIEFRRQYAGQDFGLTQSREDYFKIFNKEKTIEGSIDLRSRNADIWKHN